MARRVGWWLIVLSLAAAGCVPEAKVAWSPDGRRAAVLAADDLCLCDADGKLSARAAEKVLGVAWAYDSKRLVVLHQEQVATWDEAKALLDVPEVAAVIALARQAKAEALAHEGPLEDFKPTCLDWAPPTRIALATMYLRDVEPAGLPEKLGDKWEEAKKVTVPLAVVEVGDVADDLTVRFRPPVVRTFEGLAALRVSPDGRRVACVGTPAAVRSEDLALWVVPLEGGALRQVAERVSRFPDWSVDGRFLVYAAATAAAVQGQQHLRLGTLSRREVARLDGTLLDKFADAEDLAGVLFHDRLKVRCLDGDRIVFDGGAVRLPCTAAELPAGADLFLLDLATRGTVTRLRPEGDQDALPAAAWFEVSPDQKRVLVQTPEGVSVLALAGGNVEDTVPAQQGGLLSLPVWRSADEVCLAVPEGSSLGSPGRPEIVLWSARGAKVLSQSWPDAMVQGMLKVQQAKPAEPAAEGKPDAAEAAP